MTAAIVTMLAAGLPLLVWWVRRRAARRDAPEATRERIAEAIADGDGKAVTELLDDALRNTAPTKDQVRDD